MNEELTKNAVAVLEKRYLKKDRLGQVIETPEEMFCRVAKCIASAEPAKTRSGFEQDFYSAMTSLEFLPNSPTLMNAGNPLGQLSACFVLPVKDSIESIFEAVKNTAIIHQSGGGTGFSFSRLRPANDMVESTGGIASGPVSFMRVFNAATEAIKQGGTRRGANMGVLNVHHPDIMTFIKAKTDPAEFTNFNLSVAITDDFMAALKSDSSYPLINPRTGVETARLKAKDVFSAIAQCAATSGEPGILFIDRINSLNPTPLSGAIEATNPCGEQPLLPYEACNLGSINLARMLRKNNGSFEIDYEKLEKTVSLAVRFLDDVIDVCRYPLPEIAAVTRSNRKIGLGVMGFADMLIKLNIGYSGNEAAELAEKIMAFIRNKAEDATICLAAEKGSFPNFGKSTYAGRAPRRNATLTTIAPTGTLSIIAGCSSGIEPLYAVSYVRRALGGMELNEFTPLLKETLENNGVSNIDNILKEAAGGIRLSNIAGIPKRIVDIFQTTFDITPENHVRIQASFQKHTDNAVSKTVNLPPDSAPSDVEKIFLLAHELGCKGITVYCAGSRGTDVLSCKETLYC